MEIYESTMEDQTRMRLTRALLDNQTLEQAALDSQARCEQLERAAQDDAATIDELRAKLAHVQQDAAELTDRNRALAEDAKKLSHELVASEQLAIAAVDKNGGCEVVSVCASKSPCLHAFLLLCPDPSSRQQQHAQPSSPPPG